MIYPIERIGMKPSGFLAAWRYVDVMFNDETGEITTQAVPGKPFPNLPCLDDYRTNNRPTYSNDFTGNPLIKETCNFIDHTNFRLYATECTPYIVVQTDVNSTKCGYNTVLPTPGLPPLPFPTPPYGLYKFIDYCNVEDDPTEILVNFYKKNYIGYPIEITAGGADPVKFNIDNGTDSTFGIRATEAEISLITGTNFSLDEFYTQDEAEFMVEIFFGTELKFKGFVIPDSCAAPFIEAPFPTVIRATDCIGGLDEITYPIPLGTLSTLRQNLKDVLCYCLYMTRLNLDIVTIDNLYEVTMATGPNDDPLALSAINPIVFGDQQGQIKNCYQVLIDLCNSFRATLKQENGKWVFYRTGEFTLPYSRTRVYDYTGLFLRSEILSNSKVVGKGQPIELEAGAEVSIGNAYKRVEVLLDYGDAPSILFNGDFELWDGNNFNFWTRHGGIDISRIERSVRGSQGVVGLDNYALLFNSLGVTSTKYMQHDPIPVLIGDKINFQFLTGPLLTVNASLYIRFQVGSWCLSGNPQDENIAEYIWENNLTSAVIPVYKNRNPVITNISLPEMPQSGELQIMIFGFGYDFSQPVSIFEKNWIDNISISKNSAAGKYDVTGSLAISEQLNYFTNKPELLTIPIGDYDPTVNADRALPVKPLTPVSSPYVQNNIYAIYTPSGYFSTLWTEYGLSANAVPFHLANARAGMRVARKPYAFLRNAGLNGVGLSFLDSYSIIVPGSDFQNKVFIPISGTYSLKYSTFKGTLCELITGDLVSNDAVTPYLPNQNAVSVIQDPDSLPVLAGRGIFTEEFTQEFV